MDERTDHQPEPADPEGIFARRTLLGVMGAAFGGALGVAVLGASRNLPAAAASVATPQPTVDHTLHAAASPTASGAPTVAIDHDAQMEAAVKAFPAKTQGTGLQELASSVVNGPVSSRSPAAR